MGTSIDYSAVSHETIYQHLTGGPGSADLMEASRGWQSVAAKLQELHGMVEQAIRGIGAAQQGVAADAATHATMALMPWLDGSVAAASGMADRISHQVSSFGHTRDNMPQPIRVPEVSFSQDPATWLGDHAVEWLPGIQTGHERAQVAAQQAEQRARDLMSAYQSSSNDNLSLSQQFAQAPIVVADVAGPTLNGGAGIGGASSTGGAPVNPTHPGTAHPMLAPATPATAGHPATAAPASTAAQIASGIHQAPAAAVSPQLAGGHPGPLSHPTMVNPAAGATFGPSPVWTGANATGGHQPHGGSPFSGAGAPSRASGGFGPRPGAVLGEVHPPAGSAVPADAAGRTVRGGAGWEGAPLGATGGSRRKDDAEHQRPSYLIEQDTNAIVGELPRVAPPVIGDDG